MQIVDRLTRDLYSEICQIPFIDPHSHINPHAAAAKSLDDILGYHYYTELAHSAGLDRARLEGVAPRDRCRAILGQMSQLDNTTQYGWFLEIAQTMLGYQGETLTERECDALWDAADRVMGHSGWEQRLVERTGVERVFLTNDFDDPLEGFDTQRYVPCLRTDDLVFHLNQKTVRERLAKATGFEPASAHQMREVISILFQRFTQRGAKACAISLPPDFTPASVSAIDLTPNLGDWLMGSSEPDVRRVCTNGSFWMLAEACREIHLPFDLMIGVNRRVYPGGVHQGQDLFDQRTSLIQYAELFNAFPDVTFPISVLSSAQNQELVSYCWIFPNVVTNGHWWYSNVPAYIQSDTRARLQAAPKSKQLGYYSDAYKLEFILPKFNMYRRILAQILADDFVRPGIYSENQAIALARQLLRENSRRIFSL